MACSFNGICSDEAAQLAALGDDAGDEAFDAYADQYGAEEGTAFEIPEFADTEPPLIRIEKPQACAMSNSGWLLLRGATQWCLTYCGESCDLALHCTWRSATTHR